MSEKTVKIRAAVAVNADGKYSVAGWSGGVDADFRDVVFESLEFAGGQLLHFIETEVPIPVPQTVTSNVVETSQS